MNIHNQRFARTLISFRNSLVLDVFRNATFFLPAPAGSNNCQRISRSTVFSSFFFENHPTLRVCNATTQQTSYEMHRMRFIVRAAHIQLLLHWLIERWIKTSWPSWPPFALLSILLFSFIFIFFFVSPILRCCCPVSDHWSIFYFSLLFRCFRTTEPVYWVPRRRELGAADGHRRRSHFISESALVSTTIARVNSVSSGESLHYTIVPAPRNPEGESRDADESLPSPLFLFAQHGAGAGHHIPVRLCHWMDYDIGSAGSWRMRCYVLPIIASDNGTPNWRPLRPRKWSRCATTTTRCGRQRRGSSGYRCRSFHHHRSRQGPESGRFFLGVETVTSQLQYYIVSGDARSQFGAWQGEAGK